MFSVHTKHNAKFEQGLFLISLTSLRGSSVMELGIIAQNKRTCKERILNVPNVKFAFLL